MTTGIAAICFFIGAVLTVAWIVAVTGRASLRMGLAPLVMAGGFVAIGVAMLAIEGMGG